jgi:hypothetical protein
MERRDYMEESGVPTFIMVIAAAAMVVAVMVGMFAVTWMIMLR